MMPPRFHAALRLHGGGGRVDPTQRYQLSQTNAVKGRHQDQDPAHCSTKDMPAAKTRHATMVA
jgi:hypothetical protein